MQITEGENGNRRREVLNTRSIGSRIARNQRTINASLFSSVARSPVLTRSLGTASSLNLTQCLLPSLLGTFNYNSSSYLLTHSLAGSLAHSFSHSPARSLTRLLIRLFAHQISRESEVLMSPFGSRECAIVTDP